MKYNLTILHQGTWFTKRYGLTWSTTLLVAESYLRRGFEIKIIEVAK